MTHPETVPDPEPEHPDVVVLTQIQSERDTGELYRGALIRAAQRGEYSAAAIALNAWGASLDKQMSILAEAQAKKGRTSAQPRRP